MLTTRQKVVVLAAGPLCTALLVAADSSAHLPLWQYLLAPGGIAVVAIWGGHGSVSALMADVVGLGANSVAYSLMALGMMKLGARFGSR